MLSWSIFAGCAAPPVVAEDPDPGVVADVVPAQPVALVGEAALSEVEGVPLARSLAVAFDQEATLVVTLRSDARDVQVRFAEPARSFQVPVLGLTAGVAWEVGVEAEVGGVRSGELVTFDVEAASISAQFPEARVLALDPARSEGGYWLVPLVYPEADDEWLAAYDATDFSLAWVYSGPIGWGDVRMLPNGHLIGIGDNAVNEMDLLGRRVGKWTHDAAVGEVAIPWGLNHEVFPADDGSFWSITLAPLSVPTYPASYADPTPAGPAEIEDASLVNFATDGTVRADWSLAERLDPSRIGFSSLESDGLGYDWAHANAVVAHPDGGVVASVRHQDALVRIDADGGLKWILGDPAGWREPWAGALLAPDGPVAWPFHQHGPTIDASGVLWVMDNHSVTTTPYSGEPSLPGPSRLLGYDVDEAQRTVRQVAEWYPPDTLESVATGNAVALPRTGHLLVDFGTTRTENGVDNYALGRGENAPRVMEVDPGDPHPVVDVRFQADPEVSSHGVNVYRVAHLESLYGDAATVTRVR